MGDMRVATTRLNPSSDLNYWIKFFQLSPSRTDNIARQLQKKTGLPSHKSSRMNDCHVLAIYIYILPIVIHSEISNASIFTVLVLVRCRDGSANTSEFILF